MRAVITGGAGFIGSHLCDFLITKGWSIIVLDNLITGSEENISHLFDNPNFTFIKHDVTKHISINGEIDYVLHIASPASPVDYKKYPIQTLKVGALGTHNSVGFAKAKSAKFLLASTSEVYGDPLIHPQREDYWGNVNPLGWRGVYDESKRFAEALTMAYHRYHKIDVKIARIFNTYGPRMRLDDGRVLPNFISQALRDEPLTIYGDGTQTRSFCYISDLIEGIWRLMNSNLNEPVNLGNPDEVQIIDVAKEVCEILKKKLTIEYKPLPTDDPKIRRPDITKAKNLLLWNPFVSRLEGLKNTIEYFKQKIKKVKIL